ncbi:hypothetical protein AB0H83_19415 [Dactylosporangium sp. NPDC050688]|uniref:hypothetical protein n=1 Tax=Dactylosporangium sp. NPDC050688 TaxID=3157217 RepID=UPI0033FF06FE
MLVVWGEPGQGKTAFLAHVRRPGWAVLDLETTFDYRASKAASSDQFAEALTSQVHLALIRAGRRWWRPRRVPAARRHDHPPTSVVITADRHSVIEGLHLRIDRGERRSSSETRGRALEDLRAAARFLGRRRAVLAIDTTERLFYLDEELGSEDGDHRTGNWFLHHALPVLLDAAPRLRIVLVGRNRLVVPDAAEVQLRSWSADVSREFLGLAGIADPQLAGLLHRRCAGIPVWMALAADVIRAEQADGRAVGADRIAEITRDEPARVWLPREFMARLTRQERAAVEAAVVLQTVTQEAVESLVDTALGSQWFADLCRQSFMHPADSGAAGQPEGQWRVNALVSTAFRAHLRIESPNRFRALNLRAAQYLRTLAPGGPGVAYHLFCAGDFSAAPQWSRRLREAVNAADIAGTLEWAGVAAGPDVGPTVRAHRPELYCQAALALARARLAQGNERAARVWAQRCRRIAAERGLRLEAGESLALLGDVAFGAHDWRRAASNYAAALSTGATEDLRDHAGDGLVRANLALGRLREALGAAEQSRTSGGSSGALQQGLVRCAQGWYTEGSRLLTAAAQDDGRPGDRGLALRVMAAAALDRGETSRARALVEQAEKTVADVSPRAGQRPYLDLLALRLGRTRSVRAIRDEFARRGDHAGLGELELIAGTADAALARFRRADDRFGVWRARLATTVADRKQYMQDEQDRGNYAVLARSISYDDDARLMLRVLSQPVHRFTGATSTTIGGYNISLSSTDGEAATAVFGGTPISLGGARSGDRGGGYDDLAGNVVISDPDMVEQDGPVLENADGTVTRFPRPQNVLPPPVLRGCEERLAQLIRHFAAEDAPTWRARAHVERAYVRLLFARVDASGADLEEAADLFAAAGSPLEQFDAGRERARVLGLKGLFPQALDACEGLVTMLKGIEGQLRRRAELAHLRGQLALLAGDRPLATRSFDAARQRFDRLKDQARSAETLLQLAYVEIAAGRLLVARERLHEVDRQFVLALKGENDQQRRNVRRLISGLS